MLAMYCSYVSCLLLPCKGNISMLLIYSILWSLWKLFSRFVFVNFAYLSFHGLQAFCINPWLNLLLFASNCWGILLYSSYAISLFFIGSTAPVIDNLTSWHSIPTIYTQNPCFFSNFSCQFFYNISIYFYFWYFAWFLFISHCKTWNRSHFLKI